MGWRGGGGNGAISSPYICFFREKGSGRAPHQFIGGGAREAAVGVGGGRYFALLLTFR